MLRHEALGFDWGHESAKTFFPLIVARCYTPRHLRRDTNQLLGAEGERNSAQSSDLRKEASIQKGGAIRTN